MSNDDLEFVPDDPYDLQPAPGVVVVPPRRPHTLADHKPYNEIVRTTKQDELRQVEDELLDKAMFNLTSALSFGELDPRTDTGEPPAEWVEAMGEEQARRKYRIAMAAWAPTKDVPHGIKMAQEVSLGVLNNKSNRVGAKTALNIGTVNMVVAQQVYPELEVGGEDE